MSNKHFRRPGSWGKVLLLSTCENLRRNNNPTSWKRNLKISWNYHLNTFTWEEIIASIDKKQINSYDLKKHVLQLHACLSRDFFCDDVWCEECDVRIFRFIVQGNLTSESIRFLRGIRREARYGNASVVRGLGYGKFGLSCVSLSPDSPRVFTVGSCIKIRSSSWLK